MKEPIICYIPNWAMTYLMNSDATGLDPSEVKEVDRWWKGMTEEGYSVISPTDDTNEFCAYPEFGLACDTTKCEIL